jgi:hypothetical protein
MQNVQSLSSLLITTIGALAAIVSSVEAAPSTGARAAAAPPTSVEAIAFRTICDRYGDRCRRVWIDDGYGGSERSESRYGRRPGTYLGTIRSAPPEYYGGQQRARPVTPGNDSGR